MMTDSLTCDVDFLSTVTLSENAKKSYNDVAENAERAAQDMAHIAMETIVSAMSVNTTIDVDVCADNIVASPGKESSNVEEGKVNKILPTKQTEIERITEARKRAEKAAEDMASTALSTVLEAMKNETDTESKVKKESPAMKKESPAKKEEEVDDKWYLFWSEEHGREYYYQPATNTSLWHIPGKNNFGTNKDVALSTSNNKSKSNTTDEVEQDELEVDNPKQYNRRHSPLDDFLPNKDQEKHGGAKKKKKGISKRSLMQGNRKQRKIIWSSVSATFLACSTFAYFRRNKMVTNDDQNVKLKGGKKDFSRRVLGQDKNSGVVEEIEVVLKKKQDPIIKRAEDREIRGRAEPQELSRSVSSRSLYKGDMQHIVNATASHDRNEEIVGQPDWCKLPLLNQLHPECHRDVKHVNQNFHLMKLVV